MEQIKRILLLSFGFLFVLLGILGAFLPVMPSIPFLLIAAYCFSKSSKKFHDLLLDNPLVGPHIKNCHENNGITWQTKVLLIAGQWGGIIFSSIFFVHGLLGQTLMILIAMAATVYLLSLKTLKEKA